MKTRNKKILELTPKDVFKILAFIEIYKIFDSSFATAFGPVFHRWGEKLAEKISEKITLKSIPNYHKGGDDSGGAESNAP